MTLVSIKPGGWSVRQILTSAEATALDTNLTHALDKTTAGDTLDGYITISDTGSLNFAAGSEFNFLSGSALNVNSGAFVVFRSGSALSLDVGATMTVDCAMSVSDFTMSGTNKVKLTTRTLTRSVSCLPIVKQSGDWTIEDGAIAQTAGVSSTEFLYFDLDLPHNCVLKAWYVYIDPKTGHAGFLGTAPTAICTKVPVATGAFSSLGLQTDSLATTDLTAYEAVHAISQTGLSETVNRATHRYMIRFRSEGGANALNTFRVIGCMVTIEVSELDEAT